MDTQRNIEISPERESLKNKHGENLNGILNEIELKENTEKNRNYSIVQQNEETENKINEFRLVGTKNKKITGKRELKSTTYKSVFIGENIEKLHDTEILTEIRKHKPNTHFVKQFRSKEGYLVIITDRHSDKIEIEKIWPNKAFGNGLTLKVNKLRYFAVIRGFKTTLDESCLAEKLDGVKSYLYLD